MVSDLGCAAYALRGSLHFLQDHFLNEVEGWILKNVAQPWQTGQIFQSRRRPLVIRLCRTLPAIFPEPYTHPDWLITT